MTLNALYDLPAPAKLNLFLHIVGRRGDGMHLLQSPFVLIDWADTLHVERRADGRIHRHDLSQLLPDNDLCLRAAHALQLAARSDIGADISIDKRVPAGAGMGGGSSDAATVLLALNRLWGLHWPKSRLATIGLQLGADLPFFIGGHPAFVEGIGERLTALACPPLRFAVLKPSASLATADVFGHPALVRNSEVAILAGSSERTHSGLVQMPPEWLASVGRSDRATVDPGQSSFGRNDLQPVAEDRCPPVAQAAAWLQDRFGNSRMTGSGSAVFSRIGDSVDPSAMGADALAAFPGWTGRICRSLPIHPLQGWAD